MSSLASPVGMSVQVGQMEANPLLFGEKRSSAAFVPLCVCVYPSFQRQVIHLGVVEVPLGELHVHLAQEAVLPKSVVMPDGENERLCPEVLHANTILYGQERRFCLPWVECLACEKTNKTKNLTESTECAAVPGGSR